DRVYLDASSSFIQRDAYALARGDNLYEHGRLSADSGQTWSDGPWAPRLPQRPLLARSMGDSASFDLGTPTLVSGASYFWPIPPWWWLRCTGNCVLSVTASVTVRSKRGGGGREGELARPEHWKSLAGQ